MAMTHSQEIVKFKFHEFKKLHFPGLSDGLAFMQFATSLALQQFQLSESDIQAGVTEGPDDGGIDGFHIIVNKTESVSEATLGLSRTKTAPKGLAKSVPFDIVIVQSKSTMDGALDGKALQELHGSLNRILSGESIADLRAYPLNDKVVGQVDSYRRYRSKLVSLDPVRSFTVYLMQPIAESKVTEPDRRRATDLKKMIQGHLGKSTKVAVEVLSADGIEDLRNASQDVEGILKFASKPLDEKHGKSSALLGLVSVGDLLTFVRREKTAVLREEFFTTNVREFAGSTTPVNAAIRETLANDTDSAFWWMNNGITIIVDRATYQSDNSWTLINPQIVNGLQTTNVIHEASDDKVITPKRRKESVLTRVISELDPKLRESVIQGTNNQTLVNSIQLYANDEFQLDVERYLGAKGWFYERRRWQYRSGKVSRSRIRSILDLAQVIIAVVFLEPETARARPRDKFKTEAGYKRVFSKDVPMTLYSTLLDMHLQVEQYLKTPAALAISNDPTNDRFYILAGAVLRLSGVKNRIDYSKVIHSGQLGVLSAATLEGVHRRLYKLVSVQLDKKERDKLFKGSTLRDPFLAEIVKWNKAN